ncbi:mRNA degradation protein, mitochondrial [Fulvia fulva]|nr:mRNA degradation protein, mitochondrial [Fulvia fulva]
MRAFRLLGDLAPGFHFSDALNLKNFLETVASQTFASHCTPTNPMLGNISHSPVWRNQGYVCLACRRQKVRAHRQQRRWNSEVHHTTTSAISDSWFDTLNDISDNFGKPAPTPKAEPETKVSKKAEAKQQDDPFTALKGSLSEKVESPPGTRPSTDFAKLQQMLKEDSFKFTKQQKSAPPKTHHAKRQQRRASRETAQDGVEGFAAEEPNSTAAATVSMKMNSLVQQLKGVQEEKAAEDDGRLSWTKDAQDLAVKELLTGNDAAEQADDTEPRPLPAFNAAGTSCRIRYKHPIADRVEVPPGKTSQARKDSKVATSNDESIEGPVTYKAKTSPAASGLGGPIMEEESQPRTLVARWRKQQQQHSPFGVRKEGSGQGTLGVSFDSLRSADKVSDHTNASSKKHSTPFGVDVAASRSLGDLAARKIKAMLGAKDEETKPKVKLNGMNMNSLLTSLKSKTQEVEEVVPKAVEAVSQPDSEPANQPEPTTSEDVTSEEAKAHESLTNLYSRPRIQYSSPPAIPKRSLPDSASAAMLARDSPMPAGQSLADAMKGNGSAKQTSGNAPPESPPEDPEPSEEPQAATEQNTLDPSSIDVKPLDIPQPPVPYLEYGLDRVLFNPGVYQLQDPASRVYNFDPYLQNIMPVTEFDFNALKEYKTSSQDDALSALALKEGKRYIGSTSSMTSSLTHFHHLLSNFRTVNTSMYSREFSGNSREGLRATFTEINRAPSSIFLRWNNGTYAIDADKEYDSGNVLMLLGKSMELLLTLPKDDYERYRKSDPRQVPEEQRTGPEAYQYTTMGDFLMRSQLDAYDPRLPGNGTFDLKTRAVVSVRHSAADYERMTGYELFNLQGRWGSYEKEYYDMTRSTMLKYMLQARMGRMNGIFVAYHNVKRMFGFQYIPMHEMDRALHGQTDSCLGDQEFKASLSIMNEIFNKATAKFPNQSLRFHFETRPERGEVPTSLHVFAEPMAEKDIDAIQSSSKAKMAAYERDIMGKKDEPPVEESSSNEPLDAESGNAIEAKSSNKLTADDDATSETNNDDVSVETQTPTVHSTDAPADRAFLDSIGTSSEDLAPLFYATVIVQSKVDGEFIEGDRPTDLKKTQKWEIDYILNEYEITRHQWALYEDCKARRKHALDNSDDDSDGVEDKSLKGYLQFLKGMSEKGAEIRRKVDEMDKGKEVLRVEKGLVREREVIERVEDYMDWMYRGRDV